MRKIARIDTLKETGDIFATLSFKENDETAFRRCLYELNSGNVPMVVTLYADERGKTVARDFIDDMAPPLKAIHIIPEDAKNLTLTQSKFDFGKKCLIDNGIEADEADDVLQALCYILLNEETEHFMNK